MPGISDNKFDAGTVRRKRTRPHPRPDALAFTVNEVRQIGGPGRTKVYELIAQGRLTAVSVGGRRLITGDSLRALLLCGSPCS